MSRAYGFTISADSLQNDPAAQSPEGSLSPLLAQYLPGGHFKQ